MSDHERTRPMLTKIVATIGTPGTASASPPMLERLVEAGASVFRLNFSHGKLDDHAETLAMIREVERKLNRPVGVLGDLSGPKIRVGPVVAGGVEVVAGQDVVFVRGEVVGGANLDDDERAPSKSNDDDDDSADPREIDPLGAHPSFSCTYEGLVDDVEVGQRLLVNDGAIRMLIVDKSSVSITCRVLIGGLITTGKGINLPETRLRVDSITEKDWRCLEWAIEHQLDFVALSFVRRADEINRLRARMIELVEANEDDAREVPIIAKIEKPEALENISEILAAVDGVMVARGDLGVEMDLAEVPTIQKWLVDLAHDYGRPVIVATQMLESMIESPVPTRAEASDVANAILDGADAIMLSGETAVGKYPGVTVDTMARIARSTENYQHTSQAELRSPARLRREAAWTSALAQGAWTVANDLQAQYIVTYSTTGLTALHLSQHRFRQPIIAFSDDVRTLRRLCLLAGVTPAFMEKPVRLSAFTEMADRWMLERELVAEGATIIIVAGYPIGQVGGTNSLAVHYVGDPMTGYKGHA
ncbi:MAG: pyruvate kinase [Phycisphaerales bacterium]